MTNICLLIKYNFLKFANYIGGKKKNKSTISAILICIVLGVGVLALYSIQAWSMFKGLSPLGLSKICLFHGVLIALSVVVILGIMRAVGEKKQSDENLLLSLPLKKIEIVVAKTFSKYIFDFFFSFALIMPFSIIYMIYEGFSVLLLIFSLLLVMLIPMLSVGLSYIASFVISNIFNRSKYSSLLKSFCSVFIMIIILGLMMIKTIGYGSIAPENINTYFSDRPLTNALTNFIFNRDLVSIIITLCITIIPFVLGIFSFSSTLGKDSVGFKSKNKELKFTCFKSEFSSLVKKELSNYASNTAYVSNTIMSPVLILIFAILFCTMGLNGVGEKFGVAISQQMAGGVIALATIFILSMSLISCSTISLEGKNIWILKSSPINLNLLFLSKAMLQLIITLPSVILSSLLLLICLKLSFLDFLIVLLLPIIFDILNSFTGVLINLFLPKLDYENDAQVVKQSLAVLVNILSSIVLAIIPVLFYLYVIKDIYLVALICAGIYLLLNAIVVALLFTKGKKLFKRL